MSDTTSSPSLLASVGFSENTRIITFSFDLKALVPPANKDYTIWRIFSYYISLILFDKDLKYLADKYVIKILHSCAATTTSAIQDGTKHDNKSVQFTM